MANLKPWAIGAVVLASLWALAVLTAPSQEELAEREIGALQGDLKVRQAERIEHAAQCQALAVVELGDLARQCLQTLAERHRMDAQDATKAEQRIATLKAQHGQVLTTGREPQRGSAAQSR